MIVEQQKALLRATMASIPCQGRHSGSVRSKNPGLLHASSSCDCPLLLPYLSLPSIASQFSEQWCRQGVDTGIPWGMHDASIEQRGGCAKAQRHRGGLQCHSASAPTKLSTAAVLEQWPK